ncbi:hypothetical protein E2320_006915, partial [Naja naja]
MLNPNEINSALQGLTLRVNFQVGFLQFDKRPETQLVDLKKALPLPLPPLPHGGDLGLQLIDSELKFFILLLQLNVTFLEIGQPLHDPGELLHGLQTWSWQVGFLQFDKKAPRLNWLILKKALPPPPPPPCGLCRGDPLLYITGGDLGLQLIDSELKFFILLLQLNVAFLEIGQPLHDPGELLHGLQTWSWQKASRPGLVHCHWDPGVVRKFGDSCWFENTSSVFFKLCLRFYDSFTCKLHL